jgi:hypothetical protein
VAKLIRERGHAEVVNDFGDRSCHT